LILASNSPLILVVHFPSIRGLYSRSFAVDIRFPFASIRG
jgi:hypothetical protein